MEKITGNSRMSKAIRELQARDAAPPQSTKGATVSRTTRGPIVRPTAASRRLPPATSSKAYWG